MKQGCLAFSAAERTVFPSLIERSRAIYLSVTQDVKPGTVQVQDTLQQQGWRLGTAFRNKY
jgi:hypothetical protein